MVITIKLEFRSRLCEGNVLVPLISIVLNRNHLVRFAIRMLVFVICFLLVIKREKDRAKNKFFYQGVWRDVESRSYVSPSTMENSRKCSSGLQIFLCWSILAKDTQSHFSGKHCFLPKTWRSKHWHRIIMDNITWNLIR